MTDFPMRYRIPKLRCGSSAVLDPVVTALVMLQAFVVTMTILNVPLADATNTAIVLAGAAFGLRQAKVRPGRRS